MALNSSNSSNLEQLAFKGLRNDGVLFHVSYDFIEVKRVFQFQNQRFNIYALRNL